MMAIFSWPWWVNGWALNGQQLSLKINDPVELLTNDIHRQAKKSTMLDRIQFPENGLNPNPGGGTTDNPCYIYLKLKSW